MKKSILIKQLFFATLLTAGLSINTSCDSCSRPDGSEQGTKDGEDANGDTRGSEEPADNENSGSTERSTDESGNVTEGNKSTSIEASSSGNTGGKATRSTTSPATPKKKLSEEEITNQVENSNASNAVDSKGNPIKSSGASGSGSGTGTGSTGNNSKVTNRADQKS